MSLPERNCLLFTLTCAENRLSKIPLSAASHLAARFWIARVQQLVTSLKYAYVTPYHWQKQRFSKVAQRCDAHFTVGTTAGTENDLQHHNPW